jgi:DNA polymerase III subunit epsilon
MRSWHDRLAVFDLETTGIDTDTARIVSAHVGVLDARGRVLEQHDWLADPGVEIPDGAAAVHGITTARARAEGRPADLVVAEIVDVLRGLLRRGLPLTIYNAPYDLSLLHAEAVRHGVLPLLAPAPVIDPLVIDKAMDRYRPGKRTLTATAELYGVTLDAAHDAGADAVAAGRVAQALALRFADRLTMPAYDLHLRQERWCAAQAAGFQEYRRRTDPLFTTSGEWPVRFGIADGVAA